MTAVVVTADWLVSDTDSFISADGVPTVWSDRVLSEWADGQRSRVVDVVGRAGVVGPELVRRPFGEQFPHILALRGLQQFVVNEVEGLGSGLLVMMAPPGDGKTEAALHAASVLSGIHRGSGVLMALPTMATTDAMFSRTVDFCERAFSQRTRVTLMHSLAFCNDTYTSLRRNGSAMANGSINATSVLDASDVVVESECEDHASEPGARGVDASLFNSNGHGLAEVTDWLRGSRRGLLSPNTVCTIDQILSVAIASKWQPLRLLGVTRRVVVVDEAHAYDVHMQVLLGKLLAWLAACGVSVVALSATLSRSAVMSLVGEYRSGLSASVGLLDEAAVTVSYPGWVHVSAVDGQVRFGAVSTSRRRVTGFDLVSYVESERFSHGGFSSAVAEVLVSDEVGVLDPESDGGNALVVCNTVAAAVATYVAVRDQVEAAGGECSLFHARFPNRMRSAKAAELVDRYGPAGVSRGKRPVRSVVVATQVVEQSLDVDFDVVVSQLAPVSLLLQRDGRGHRHAGTPRPKRLGEARLIVLAQRQSEDDGTGLDMLGSALSSDVDCAPYPLPDLQSSWNAMSRRAHTGNKQAGRKFAAVASASWSGGFGLRIPDDVQEIVNEVVDDAPSWLQLMVTNSGLASSKQAADVVEARMRAVAEQKSVLVPSALSEMSSLTEQSDPDHTDLSARYDLNSVAVLPCFVGADGVVRMGSTSGPILPMQGPFTSAQVGEVMQECVSLSPSRAWEQSLYRHSRSIRPRVWSTHAVLSNVEVTLLSANGTVTLGDMELACSPDLGVLVNRICETAPNRPARRR